MLHLFGHPPILYFVAESSRIFQKNEHVAKDYDSVIKPYDFSEHSLLTNESLVFYVVACMVFALGENNEMSSQFFAFKLKVL